MSVELDPQSPIVVPLRLNHMVPAVKLEESEWVKELVLSSGRLRAFHGREVVERGAVVLPRSYYEQPQRRYPTVYAIPGFGGDHRPALRYRDAPSAVDEGEVEFIRVFLSGDCAWGHHVYADSATNGPRGQCLVEELIPYVDQEYRTIPETTARFVTGHSSGGWSSLWLQVNYPEVFGGVWSTAPDPVDFRDFQRIDLYASPAQSMFVEGDGSRRPLARRGDVPVLWFDDFSRMDDVLGRGGQLRSFEAVFSPIGDDGLPKRMWDRTTGTVDPTVVQSWKKYDLRLLIERDWERLDPLLRGKLHIIVGSLDTYYLEGAVLKLADALRELGSDAEISVVEGRGHGDLLTPDLRARIRREMSRRFLSAHGSAGNDEP